VDSSGASLLFGEILLDRNLLKYMNLIEDEIKEISNPDLGQST
jgi:hypothetical protein